MKKSYYISHLGEKTKSAVFGKPYIFISCGSKLKIKKKKVKKLLEDNITYKIDIIEGEVAEIHYTSTMFNRARKPSIQNIVSKYNIEQFLMLIV